MKWITDIVGTLGEFGESDYLFSVKTWTGQVHAVLQAEIQCPMSQSCQEFVLGLRHVPRVYVELPKL